MTSFQRLETDRFLDEEKGFSATFSVVQIQVSTRVSRRGFFRSIFSDWFFAMEVSAL